MKNRGIRIGLKVSLMAALVLSLLPTMSSAQFVYKGACDGVSAIVDITTVSHSNGVVSANGTWQVSGGANGIHLWYYIDNVLYQDEPQSGTSGSLPFEDDYDTPCAHILKVVGCPKVDSTICYTHCHSDSEYFRPDTPQAEITSCTWNGSSCETSIASGTCTGNNGSSDCPSDVPYWGLNGEEPEEGNWTQAITCRPMRDMVVFKVIDEYTEDESDESNWPCCAE
ncbi:MAG: hypothetical protein GY832_04890 [Chloroflexi bacterium]|nr:hypothetical protein [Chloroflexota bacterium]